MTLQDSPVLRSNCPTQLNSTFVIVVWVFSCEFLKLCFALAFLSCFVSFGGAVWVLRGVKLNG